MMTVEQVTSIIDQLKNDKVPKPDSIKQIAYDCLGWPYVFGAWGELCTPANRRRRVRDDHPTILSRCPALNGKTCEACKWGVGVRMYDCRGFTAWLLRQFDLDIAGQGATSQYNTQKNWVKRGPISEMPDCVCCVFKQKGSTMEHTGMHVGGGQIVHCSVNVQTGSIADKGWTHYAIPVGLYAEGEIPVTIVKPILRKGSKGDAVKELQEQLNNFGYPCGTADGIFGTKTLAAVKAFQKGKGLETDGVVGAKTWEALEQPQEPKPTYKIVCQGVTWDQAMKIREICPTAEMIKESQQGA